MPNPQFGLAIEKLLDGLQAMNFKEGQDKGLFRSESEREELSSRIEALMEVFEGEKASQQSLMEALFHGLKESSAKVKLSNFTSATSRLAEACGFKFKLQTDRSHGKPLSEKQCSLLIEGLEASLAESALGPDARQTLAKQEREAIPAMASVEYKAFVSVAEKDLALAEHLIGLLKPWLTTRKINCRFWIFKRELIGGNDFNSEIQESIANSDFGLLMLSQYFFESKYIMRSEYPHFFREAESPASLKPCYPLMLRTVPFDLFPDSSKQVFRGDQSHSYFDVTTPQDQEKFALALSADLKEFVSKHLQADKNSMAENHFRAFALLMNPFPGDKASCDVDRLNMERIPARASRHQLGDILKPDAERNAAVDVQQYLQDWVANKPDIPYLAILGEYGMGKTWACLNFVKHQLEAQQCDKNQPAAIYLDLRRYNQGVDLTRESAPSLTDIIDTTLVRQLDVAEQHNLSAATVIDLVRKQGAIIVFDGLDEVANHLSKHKRTGFFHQLVGILPANHREPSQQKLYPKPGKVIVSCRSNLFASVREETNLFTKQQREGAERDNYEVLRMLPFTEEQIRAYFEKNLPERPVQAIMDLLKAVHNLRELAERPYNLSLLRIQIDKLERQRQSGRTIYAVTLYQNLVQEWLERDEGKHIIEKDHKPLIMGALAAHLARLGQRSLPHAEVSAWFDEWLLMQPTIADAYKATPREDLKADLRTATFIVRSDSDHFQFAHTSLQEFFLADFLLRAVEKQQLDEWRLPMISEETFDFMGQLLQSDARRLAQVQKHFPSLLSECRQLATELALKFWLKVQAGQWELDLPRPATLDCKGGDFREWKFYGREGRPLNLSNAVFDGAKLGFSRWRRVLLNGSSFSQASLPSSEMEECQARGSQWLEAQLMYSRLRNLDLFEANFIGADLRGVEAGFCELHEANIPKLLKPELWYNHTSPPFDPLLFDELGVHICGSHLSSVSCVSYAPDGQMVLTGSLDNTARLWDLQSGYCLMRFVGHSDCVRSVTFSPDGLRVLTGSDDKTARLWDAQSGKCLQAFEAHEQDITSVAFAPNGLLFLTGSSDSTARLWDAQSGNCLLNLDKHKDSVLSVAFARDGRYLLTGSYENTARLWDVQSGECLLTLEGHKGPVNGVAFAPDGRYLLTGSYDKTLRLWDSQSGACLLNLKGHDGPVLSVAIASDCRRILSGSSDGTAKVWDAQIGECVLTLRGAGQSILSVDVAPDGRTLIMGSNDGTTSLCDARTGDYLWRLNGDRKHATSAIFSPDGDYLAVGYWDNTVRVWDAATGECLQILVGHKLSVLSVAFSPNGQYLVTGSLDQTARMWNIQNGKCLLNLKGHKNAVWSVAFAPDGQRLLTGSLDNSARLYDARSGECLLTLEECGGSVRGVAFSPDGERVAVGLNENIAQLWNVKSGKCLLSLEGHNAYVTSVAFSPDGLHLVTGSGDNTARLWDARSGKCLLKLEEHEGAVWSVAFAPDGQSVLTGSLDNSARLWDAKSGDCLLKLDGHEGYVRSVAFSPDGLRLVTASWDNSCRVWDAKIGRPLMVIHSLLEGEYLVEEDGEFTLASRGAWRYARYRRIIPENELLPGQHPVQVIPAEAVKPLPFVD